MGISYRSGQHVDWNGSDSGTLPSAPNNGNLLLDFCGHFTNQTSCQGDSFTSLFEQFASEWDIGSGYKYAGSGESSTQTPGSVGLSRSHHLAEFTGVNGTIGTDVPSNHKGVDQALSGGAYSTTSYNTAANNEGVYGLVGVSASGTAVSDVVLSGGNNPQILSEYAFAGSRNTRAVIFYDQFPTSGTGVQYTLTVTGGTGTIKGFYGLLALANFDPLTATASMAVTEAADTFSATATAADDLTAALSEANDTFAATAAVDINATAALAEANDAMSASASPDISATAALTEANDAMSASATVLSNLITMAATEANDAMNASAQVPSSAALLRRRIIIG